jgi:hypothetical protein
MFSNATYKLKITTGLKCNLILMEPQGHLEEEKVAWLAEKS